MTTYFGDSPIKRMTLSQSWGINPATAVLECVGTLTPALDETMWLTIGGATWFGRVKSYKELTNPNGVTTTLTLVDNRDVLMQSCIFAQFNMQDENGRWYYILPGSDWIYQERNYLTTGLGLPPRIIIDYILEYTGLSYRCTSERVVSILASNLNTCTNMDWNLGKKCGTALLEVCDSLGLHFTLTSDDPNTILIGRKGETVNFLTGNFPAKAEGMERIFTDNRIIIVGDPNIYEIADYPLDVDWPSAWNSITYSDGALLVILRAVSASDPLSVTVGQMPSQYRDDEYHAGHPRNDMLAVDYAKTIPYKVYKIDLADTISLNAHTSTLSNLMPINDRLVSDTDVQVKVKCTGFTLDPQRPLQPLVTTVEEKSGGFEVDRANGKIIFHEGKFKGTALVQVGNQYKLDESTIIPDIPLLTFAVQREIYTKIWGTGSRTGIHHVRNLRYEYLCTASGSITGTVERGVLTPYFYSYYIAASLLNRASSAASGFVTRKGQCGYQMSDTFDRITITLDAKEGITENVTYTSEQPQLGVPTEREMERRVKAITPKTDLAKANEIWDAVRAAIADAKSTSARSPTSGGGSKSWSPEATPIMDPGNVISAKNYGATFDFADALCSNGIDATTGQHNVRDPASVVNDDPSFMGVVIQDCGDFSEDVKLKCTGLATVKVNGVVVVGDTLGLVAGQKYCEAGKTGVGIAKEVNGAGTGYIRTLLGAGSGEGALVYTEEESNPTAVSGKLNINRQPSTNHHWIHDGTAWRRMLGFM